MQKHWQPVWYQAHAPGGPRQYDPQGCTVGFSFTTAIRGDGIRLRFANYYGAGEAVIAGASVKTGRHCARVTQNGCRALCIRSGEQAWSDPIPLSPGTGARIEIRLFFTQREQEGK